MLSLGVKRSQVRILSARLSLRLEKTGNRIFDNLLFARMSTTLTLILTHGLLGAAAV